MSHTDDERYAMHQRSDCSRAWFHDGPCAPAAMWAEPEVAPMTDTTAPRTAAPPTICKCGLAKSYHPRLSDHEYEPRYEPNAWRDGYERGRREAIEPLLALVRAAQFIADRHVDSISREAARDALAALPESIRVAAKKPE